jgi:hypothetical protein
MLAFTSVYFTDPQTGWTVGYYGNILKTTNGGTVSVVNLSASIPENFSLFQNYPNPFNPSTKIKFDVPYSPFEGGKGDVKLVVFNILGQQIAELVNQQLLPGSYEVEWPAPSGDASGFASGVYFYSLITESFRETKKMVLIK